MPNRIVRENILSSVPVASLGWPEEVFYRRLMSVVDDYGRYEALPQLVRARCYPLQTDQVRVADISRWMAACQKAGLVVLYEVDGKQFLEITKFGQQIRSHSKFPPLISNDINCKQVIADAHLDVSVSVVEGVKGAPAVADDLLHDVSPQVAKDFRKLRKAKKAELTETAVAGIRREAAKAGFTLEAALAMCCERGWTGFKAEWVVAQKPASVPGSSAASRRPLT